MLAKTIHHSQSRPPTSRLAYTKIKRANKHARPQSKKVGTKVKGMLGLGPSCDHEGQTRNRFP